MEPLVFANKINLNLNEIVISDSVIVDTTAPVTITITNGTFIHNGSDTGVNSISVVNGDTVAVKVQSSSELGTVSYHTISSSDGQSYIFRTQTKFAPYFINTDNLGKSHFDILTSVKSSTSKPNFITIDSSFVGTNHTTLLTAGPLGSSPLYYVDTYNAKVNVINTDSNRVTKFYSITGHPVDCCATDNHIVVVTEEGNVVFIDKVTEAVQEIFVGHKPTSIQCFNNELYITTLETMLDTVALDPYAAYYISGDVIDLIATATNMFIITKTEYAVTDIAGQILSYQTIGSNLWSITLGTDCVWIADADKDLGTVFQCAFDGSIINSFKVEYTPSFVLEHNNSVYISLYDNKLVGKYSLTGTNQGYVNTLNKPTIIDQVNGTIYVRDFDKDINRLVAFDSIEDTLSITPTVTQFDTDVTSGHITIEGVSTPIRMIVDDVYSSTIIVNGIDSGKSVLVSDRDDVAIKIHTVPQIGKSFHHTVGIFVGSTFYEWLVIARLIDSVPKGFYFVPQYDVDKNTDITSNIVVIADIEDGIGIQSSVDIGSIIQNGIDVGSTATLHKNDEVALVLRSSDKAITSVFATLTIGQSKYAFGIITKADDTSFYVQDQYACSNVLTYDYALVDGLVVGDSTNNFVSVIDTINSTETDIDTHNGDNLTEFLQDAYVAVADLYANQILIIDVYTKGIVKIISGFSKPASIGYTLPDYFNRATPFIANAGNNQIIPLDQDTYEKRPEFYQCDFTPYSLSGGIFNALYASMIDADKIAKFTNVGYNLTFVQYINLPVGSKPGRIWNDNDILYIPLTCDNRLCVLDTKTDAVSYITVGSNPTCITGNDQYLWVTNSFDNTVTQIDRNTLAKTTLNVGVYPTQITYFDNKLYVGCFQNNVVEVYNATTTALETTFDLPNSCYGIDADGIGNIWIVSFYSNTPYVIGPANLFVDTAQLLSDNLDVIPNQLVKSNTLAITNRRRTHVDIPSNYYDSSLYIDGTKSLSNVNSVVNPNNIQLESTVYIDGYSAYIPVMSPGNATVYKVQSLITVPDPFYFSDTYDAYVRHWYTSDVVTINGMSDDILCDITIDVGEIILNGINTHAQTVQVKNYDTIAIHFKSIRYYSNFNVITVTAADSAYTTTWKLHNIYVPDATDDARERNSREWTKVLNLREFTDADVYIQHSVTFDQPITHEAGYNSVKQYSSGLYTPFLKQTKFITANDRVGVYSKSNSKYAVSNRTNADLIVRKYDSALPRAADFFTRSSYDDLLGIFETTSIAKHVEVVIGLDTKVETNPIYQINAEMEGILKRPRKWAVPFSSIIYQVVRSTQLNTPVITIVGLSVYRPLYVKKSSSAVRLTYNIDIKADAVYSEKLHGIKKFPNPFAFIDDGWFPTTTYSTLNLPTVYAETLSLASANTEVTTYVDDQFVTNSTYVTLYDPDAFHKLDVSFTYYDIKPIIDYSTFGITLYAREFVQYQFTDPITYTNKYLVLSNLDYLRHAEKYLIITNASYDFSIKFKHIIHDSNQPIVSKDIFRLSISLPIIDKSKGIVFSFDPIRYYEKYHYYIPEHGEVYGIHWFDCFESCIKAGMFNDANSAAEDAVAHGKKLSEVTIGKSAHNCWVWSINQPPTRKNRLERVAGYIKGG